MDRQDGDRVGVRVELGGRRVVARLDERLRGAAPRRSARSSASSADCAADDLEEAGDVASASSAATVSVPRAAPGCRCRAGTRRAAPRPAARARLGVAAQVRDESWTVARVSGATRRMPGCRSSSSRTSRTERFRRRAMLTIAVRSSPPSPYDLGGRQGVQVDARVRGRRPRAGTRAAAGPRAGRTGPTCRRSATGCRPC